MTKLLNCMIHIYYLADKLNEKKLHDFKFNFPFTSRHSF